MIHIPALRFGKTYTSLEKATLVHHVTGEPVAEVSEPTDEVSEPTDEVTEPTAETSEPAAAATEAEAGEAVAEAETTDEPEAGAEGSPNPADEK